MTAETTATYGSSTDETLSDRIRDLAVSWATAQRQLVQLAAKLADSDEWLTAGSPTAAHRLADLAGIEPSTAREWIRIGRRITGLPAVAAAFARGELSYSKVRSLTRIANADNESELLGLALKIPAGSLGRALAAWVARTSEPEELAAHHHRQRSITWRTEPDGMISCYMRLPPLIGGKLIAALSSALMRSRPRRPGGQERRAPADAWPAVAQQRVDSLEDLLAGSGGVSTTELVVHVRGDGSSLDDGTPISDSVVERIAPTSFLRVLLHDCEGRPINASSRRRHPTMRQKRVVKERDRACVDCGRQDLLEYDHNPPYDETGRTIIEELELRCAPCHSKRHAA